MTDRLKDLKRGAVNTGDVVINVRESDALNAKGEKSALADFFGDVELVKKNINTIKNVTKRVGEIQQQVILATTNDREAELSAEFKPLVEETNKTANLAKQILQKLREDTERMKTKDEKQSDIRIRENLVSTLTRKFVDVMKEYQSVQTKYKTELKKKAKRQVQIVKADASNEEVEKIMAMGGADQIFKDAILKGEAADSVRNMYMHVADKYQDVLTIEASVAELHQMFIDLAMLTEQQGELLDQIEFQVKNASDYIDEGNSEMIQAIEYQKNIRKRQCCILIAVLVLIGIIVGVIMMKT